MIKIAPTSKAKDKGPKDGGEEWENKVNIIYMKQITDFIIDADNTVAQWNQGIWLGKEGGQWMTVDNTFTNTKVGGLTDADFLTDVTADCTGICHLSEWDGMPFPGFDLNEDEGDFLQ